MMDEPSNNLTAFESEFEAWLSKAGPPSLERMDDVETGSVGSQIDKNNNTDSDVDGDLPPAQLSRESPPLISSHMIIQNNCKTTRVSRPMKTQSVVVCQAIKRKYFSNYGGNQRQQTACNKLNKQPTNSNVSKKYSKATHSFVNNIGAKCPTTSHNYTSASRESHSLRKYISQRSQFIKSTDCKFTDGHSISVPHSTEVSPVSDAGYGEDIAVDSEHDDISRRSNGYHSMEEFQLTSVSPPSQSESPLSSAGEGNHPPFLCSKSPNIGFNVQSVYIDRRAKSARKNHSPHSYDADSDFVESPQSCHLPSSKSPSHTVSHCETSKSPEHLAVLPMAKRYKVESQRDEERPLILKIKCDRSPQHKKLPVYFCENVTPSDSPPKLKIVDAERISHSYSKETNSRKRRLSRCHSELSNSSHDLEQRPAYKQSTSVESVADEPCECDSVSKELLTQASPDHSCDDAVLEEEIKTPRQNRQKSRRNSSRVCGCCMSSPKRHRFRGEKRKRSLSISNTPGAIVFTSGTTAHIKCDVTNMSPQQKKFVKSALNLSSLQQKLHTLFIHLFPRLEMALVQIPPESLRFEDMLDEVIRTLEGSPEEEELKDSEELSNQLLNVSLKADPMVTVFEPKVQLCNTPKDCLEEFQGKIYTLLKLLLPDLTLKYEYVLRFPKDLEKFLDSVVAWNYRTL